MKAALLADHARPDTLWMTAYRNLLWYDSVGAAKLPHVFDFNVIKKDGSAWRTRAETVDSYLQTAFGIMDVQTQTDQLMVQLAPGRQRQNYLGTGLSCLVGQALSLFNGISHEAEVPVADLVPSAKDKSVYRGSRKIDLLVEGKGRPVVAISNKWSLRNDRDTEVAHQSEVLKAHSRIHAFVVVTNEFGLGRLQQLLDYDTIEGVYHLNRAVLEKVHGPTLPNGRLRDVSTLFADVKRWTA
jgi:hypothetical protein